jgi:hypothetical protein
VAASILVVVVAFGVAVSQSRPPSIAALAPNVQQHAHQKSLQGNQGASALGASAPTGVPATPTPAASANAAGGPNATPTPNALANRPVQLHCFGSPPHQTDDPQSPPCKQSFAGSNGGSTARGVTANTIYVAWPDLEIGFPGVENATYTKDLATYFNNHFEMYGRHIELVGYNVDGSGFSTAGAQKQVQDADMAAGLHGGVFASLAYAPVGGTAFYYYDRLAQDGVLSVQSAPLLVSESHLASSAYLWSTLPGYDKIETNLGNLYCNQLKGQKPLYAGPPTPPAQAWGNRKIAVFYETTTGSLAIDPQPLVNALNACGAQATAQALSDDSASNTAAINRMQQNQDTTVACLCNAIQLADLMSAGSQQTFFPEWLVSDEQFLAIDSAGAQQKFPTEQQGHVIGIGYNNEFLDPSNEFWYRAVKEVDAAQSYSQRSQNVYAYYRYEELMMLASGIQQAGPNLTAQSFQQGLYDTQFSNVGHGARPFFQAAVGFGPGDHSFFDDAAAIWFSTADTSYTGDQGQNGTYCYSHGGDRSQDWLRPSPVFYQQPCRGG